MNLLDWLRSGPPPDVAIVGGEWPRLPQPRVLTIDDVLDVVHIMAEATGAEVTIYGTAVQPPFVISREELRGLSDLHRSNMRLIAAQPQDVVGGAQDTITVDFAEWFPPFVYLSGYPRTPEQRESAQRNVEKIGHVLVHAGRPFVQRRRLTQLGIGVFDALLAAAWIVGAATAPLNLGLAVVGSFTVAVTIVAVHRWVMNRQLIYGLTRTTWVRWERFDRVKLAEERAKARANLRAGLVGSAITLGISLLGIFVTAYLRGDIG